MFVLIIYVFVIGLTTTLSFEYISTNIFLLYNKINYDTFNKTVFYDRLH